jgi:hypothetical protein
MTLFFWIAASFALAAPGASQSPTSTTCDPDEPKHCAAPLQRGQAAPFDGQLLTPELAVSLGLKADQCDARVTLEADFCKKAADLERSYAEYIAEVDEEAAVQRNAVCQKQLETALAVPLIERPWLVATITAVLTVTAGSLAVWSAGQLR